MNNNKALHPLEPKGFRRMSPCFVTPPPTHIKGCQKISSTSVHLPSSSSSHPLPCSRLLPLLRAIADHSWIICAASNGGLIELHHTAKKQLKEREVIEKRGRKQKDWGVEGWVTGTLTVNYLGNMAIRAAMSVSERLSVIWSLGTCRRIQSTDNLLKVSQLFLLSCVHCQTILLSLIIHLDRNLSSCCLESGSNSSAFFLSLISADTLELHTCMCQLIYAFMPPPLKKTQRNDQSNTKDCVVLCVWGVPAGSLWGSQD